jgi:hypothetical protein
MWSKLLNQPWRIAAAIVAAVLVGAGTPAEAGFTAVKQPKRSGGASHEQILEHVYGGDFVADPSGLGFSNDTGVTVTRLSDTAGPGDAGGTDSLWSGNIVSARTLAAFGRKHRAAGYFGTNSRGHLEKYMETVGRKFAVTGQSDAPGAVDGELVFARGRKANRVFSSLAGSNRDGADHLVTYQVDGATPDGTNTYLLCWEDKLGRRSDRDFNDMVVEVRTASKVSEDAAAAAAISEPLLIPLPPALWSGLAGLAGVGALGAVKRVRGGRW